MISKTQRIDALAALGGMLQDTKDDHIQAAYRRAYFENRWFTVANCEKAIQAIASALLKKDALEAAAAPFPESNTAPKTIALIPSGNVPLEGFSDWLAICISGHHARVKLNEKDKILLPFILRKLGEIAPELQAETYFLSEHERLSGFDAVLAEDMGEKANLFQTYFSKYPNLIRKKRTSVAILTGAESQSDLYGLSEDLIGYFGLYAQAVSKLYVPKKYDFMPLLQTLFEHKDLIQHDKYKNNYDYNLTLFILNKINHHTSGNLLVREEKALFSRIASVHFEEYSDVAKVEAELSEQKDKLAKVVSNHADFKTVQTSPFGSTNQVAFAEDALTFLRKLP